MDRLSEKRHKRMLRRRRIRKKLSGTSERPRMTVFRSNRHISLQVIDDASGKTLVSVSTLEKELSTVKRGVQGAKLIGQKAAERLETEKISTVIFDRNGYRYHGIIKAIADGAREAGLKF